MDGLQVGEYPIRVSIAKSDLGSRSSSSIRAPAGDRRNLARRPDRPPRQRNLPPPPHANPPPPPHANGGLQPSRPDLERPRQQQQQPAHTNGHSNSRPDLERPRQQPGQAADQYRGGPRGSPRDSREAAVPMEEDPPPWDQQHHPGTAGGAEARDYVQHSYDAASAGAPALEQQAAMLPPLNRSPLDGRGIVSVSRHPPERQTTVPAAQHPAAPALEELALMTDEDIAAMHGWDTRRPTDRHRIAEFRRETVMAAKSRQRQDPPDDVIRHPQQQPHQQPLQPHVGHVSHDRLAPSGSLPEMGSVPRGLPLRHDAGYNSGGGGSGNNSRGDVNARRPVDMGRLNHQCAPLSNRELAERGGRGVSFSERELAERGGRGVLFREREPAERDSRGALFSERELVERGGRGATSLLGPNSSGLRPGGAPEPLQPS